MQELNEPNFDEAFWTTLVLDRIIPDPEPCMIFCELLGKVEKGHDLQAVIEGKLCTKLLSKIRLLQHLSAVGQLDNPDLLAVIDSKDLNIESGASLV